MGQQFTERPAHRSLRHRLHGREGRNQNEPLRAQSQGDFAGDDTAQRYPADDKWLRDVDASAQPNGIFTEDLATKALTTSRNRLELFSEVEQFTHGRIAELAKRSTYMKLLKTLGVGDDG